MLKRTNLEVADIIDAFVEGTEKKWDWDDFCSLRIENHELDTIRVKCINLTFTHPPLPGDGYCNAEGIQVLREISKDLGQIAGIGYEASVKGDLSEARFSLGRTCGSTHASVPRGNN